MKNSQLLLEKFPGKSLTNAFASFICRQENAVRRSVIARVKGRMSLWNGMWHDLRNDIIMWKVLYMQNDRKK